MFMPMLHAEIKFDLALNLIRPHQTYPLGPRFFHDRFDSLGREPALRREQEHRVEHRTCSSGFPSNLKLQQPQLPQSKPDGQPTESSKLAHVVA